MRADATIRNHIPTNAPVCESCGLRALPGPGLNGEPGWQHACPVAIRVDVPLSMGAIRFVAEQMRFLGALEALGYRAELDYVDSAAADTITVLTVAMAADPNVVAVFARYGVSVSP